VSGRDITKRKQVENALRENEERYRSVFENTGTATVIIEQDRTISMANTEFERLSGFTKEEIEGKMKWTAFVLREDLERMTEYHGNRREGLGDPPTEYEFRFIDRAGRVLNILNKVSMIPGTRKSVASLLDISERKRIEEEKRRLEGQLRQAQKMESLGTLAGGIAHDFNNILAAIIGHTEIAHLQIPEESKARTSLEKVLKASERAKDLVKQILSFSRQTEQELRPTLLEPIVKEVLKLLRASLPATIEIRYHHDKEFGIVRADPIQIHQVLMNLCTNAAHAMGETVGVLEISLAREHIDAVFAANHADMKPGPYVRMTVSDTGHGIPPETMERIFEPYFTTKEKGKGTGLGLAVVHGIVKSHGGSVAVESEPGKGTTFHVFLPVVEGSQETTQVGDMESLPAGHECILFVDDEEGIAEIGEQMLEYLGYKVVATTSSIEALRLFQAQPHRFDLVITDKTMPGMTGEKLAGEIRRTRPDVPIILCTGYNDVIAEQMAKDMGVQEFVTKPLDLSMFALVVRKVLDKK
jgi:PAS domain S-box-containing protein